MNGFDSEFNNLKDYILKITYRIWEEGNVECIRNYYAEKISVKTPISVSDTIEEVINTTYETLKIFPDRKLLGEDVIGSEEQHGLFYSSHRILSSATHLGDGFFGSPTGYKISYRVIADCICRGNKVIDEWMVRDQSAIVKQIGIKPQEFGHQLALNLKNLGGAIPKPEGLVKRWEGSSEEVRLTGLSKDLAQCYKSIWEDSEFDILKKTHNRACHVHAPEGKFILGRNKLIEFLRGFTKSFRNGNYVVHNWIINEEEAKNTRVALRWSFSAEHNGLADFGKPTGAPIVIMAITHTEIQEGLVVREYHAIDEISLWMQIYSYSIR